MNVLHNIEHLLPEEIEKRSFEIISKELKAQGIEIPKEQEMVTKRVIHTSADFDYTKTLVFSKNAVQIAKELIRELWQDLVEKHIVLWLIQRLHESQRREELPVQQLVWRRRLC